MEFIAALTGTIYINRTKNIAKQYKLFVYFLWSIFIIDVIGSHTGLAYSSNYEYFSFIEKTPFRSNNWYFNIVNIYFFACYLYFIRDRISSLKFRQILKWIISVYMLFATVNLFISDDFFSSYITANFMVGTFIILFTILLYFYDMLADEKILYFYKRLFFYVAVGVCIQMLVTMPIHIYHKYIGMEDLFYLEFYRAVLRYANIFLYSSIAIGFIMEYRYRNNTSFFTNKY